MRWGDAWKNLFYVDTEILCEEEEESCIILNSKHFVHNLNGTDEL